MKHFIYITLVLTFLTGGVMYVHAMSTSDSFTTSFTAYTFNNIPPTVPTGVVATPISETQINLSWMPSTDINPILGYVVYRDGGAIATTSGVTFSDTLLTASTTYTYAIQAFDNSYNYSATSTGVSTTTLPVPVVIISTSTPITSPTLGPISSGGSSFIYDLNIAPQTTDSLITFDTVSPARSTISWGLTPDFEAGTITSILYDTAHEIDITNLIPDTQYYVRITVVGAQGSEQTINSQFVTASLAPSSIVNPSNFTAVPKGTGQDGIDLSWTNPIDQRFAEVQIVRSTIFFPRDQYDGVPVYEGSAQNFFDASAIPGTTYYYALFAKAVDGTFSSGVLAHARIGLVGESLGSVPSNENPFTTAPQASTTNPIINRLTLHDFDFIQDGRTLNVSTNNTILIDGTKNLTIRLEYDKVPEILKTIAVSLTDPTDSSKAFIFLLRANTDKTYYEANVGALGVSGNFPLAISILDYQNQSLKQIAGSLVASVGAIAISPHEFGQLSFWLIIILLVIILIVILRLLSKKNRKEAVNTDNTIPPTVIALLILIGSLLGGHQAHAFNQEINYQGKLANASNVSVADGQYPMVFKLYTTSSTTTPIWTETDYGANQPTTSGGLFSVMLGSTTPLTGVDFTQTLYLGVTVASDTEMTPRKIIGAVPAAFVAGTSTIALSANTLQNITPGQFFRNDQQNATSSASTFLNIIQNGAGKIAEFFTSAGQSALAILSNGNVGIGSTTPSATLSIQGTSSAPTTNLLSIASSSGASLFTVLPNGNVGVGTTSPSNTLSVAGGGFFNGNITGTNLIATGTLNVAGQTILGNASTSNLTTTGFHTVIGTTTTTGLSVGSLSGLLWGTNGAVSAISTSSLGLASASALTALTSALSNGYDATWNGTAFTNSLLQNNGTVAGINATSSLYTFNIKGTSGINPFNVASSSGTSLLTILNNGNVGIGSSTPGSILSVIGNSIASNILSILGGSGISGVQGQGITLQTGSGSGSGSNGALGGDFVVTTGSGATGGGGTGGRGGNISFTLGNGTTYGPGVAQGGGSFSVTTGNGGSSGVPGNLPATGGAITLTAGNGGAAGTSGIPSGMGGTITLVAGNAGTVSGSAGGNGGNIILTPGLATATGTPGYVGIGTTSPSNLLSVAGNGFFNGTITGTNIIATGTLTVSGQTTLANASSSNFTSNGFLNVTGTTTTGGLSVASLSGLLWGTNGAVSAVGTSSLGLQPTLTGGVANTLSYWTGSGTLAATSSPVVGYITATSTTLASTFPVMTNGIITVIHKNGSVNYYNATSTGATGNANGNALLAAVANAQTGDSFYLASTTFDLGSSTIDESMNQTGSFSIHGAGKYSTVITTSKNSGGTLTLSANSQLTDISVINTGNGSNVFAIIDNGNPIASTTVSNVFATAKNDAVLISASSTIYFYNVLFTGGHRGLNVSGTYPDYPNVYVYDSELDGTGNGGTTESVGSNNSSQGTTTLFNTNLNASGSLYCFGNDTAGGSTSFTYIYGGVITSNCSITNDYLFQSSSAFVGVTSNTNYDPTMTAGIIHFLDATTTRYSLGSSGASSTVLINANGVAQWASGLSYTGTNFGIGTTSPSNILSVAGNGFFNGTITGTNIIATGTLTVSGQSTLASATLTNATTTNLAISSLANTVLSVNALGQVVATTTTGGTGTNYFSNSGATTTLSTGSNLVAALFAAPYFTATSTTATSTFAGEVMVGPTNPNFYPATPLLLTTNTNNYGQLVLQNLNSGNNASADFIVGGDKMNDSSYYGDLGCNSSTFNQAGQTVMPAFDCYLYSSDSNLDIGTASTTGPSNINFFTGGTLSSNSRMTITTAGNVGIGTTSPSNLLSVAGNTWINGNITGTNIIATGTLTVSATTTTKNLNISSLASTFLAADASGNIIATTTPTGSGTNYFSNSGATTTLSTGSNLVAALFAAPYFTATSTTATSTFAGGVSFANGNSTIDILGNNKSQSLWATGTSTSGFTDGVGIDYIQGANGNGRITVGASDFLSFYNNADAFRLGYFDPNGNFFSNTINATSTTGTSTFAGAVGIGTSTPISMLSISAPINVPSAVLTISSSTQTLFQVMNTTGRTGSAGADLKLYAVTNPGHYSEIFTDKDEANPTYDDALYILPPNNQERIYFGDSTKTAYSLNFSHVSQFESVPFNLLQQINTDANFCPTNSCDILGNNSGGDAVISTGATSYIANPENTVGGLGQSSLAFKSYRNTLSAYAGNTNATGAFVFDTATTTVGLGTAAQTDWKVNGSIIMRLNASGSLGIGSSTLSASNLLTVAGNDFINGNETVTNITATGTLTVSGKTSLANASTTNLSVSGFYNQTGIAGTNPFVIASSSAAVPNLLTLLQNGNLGIGSTTPSTELSVQSTSGLAGTNPLFVIASSTSAGLSTTTLLTLFGNGNFALGSTSPSNLLTVAGNDFINGNETVTNITATGTLTVTSAASSTFTGSINSSSGNSLVLQSNGTTNKILLNAYGGYVDIGTTTGVLSTLTVSGSACFATTTAGGTKTACGNQSGAIYYDHANTGTYDVAEDYQTSDPSITAGEIVAVDPSQPKNIIRAITGSRVLGVVSTNPGMILGGADSNILTETVRPVALSGRIPTMVSTEGGSIAIGDSIALSSVPGVGMKASGSGEIVGIALEPYSGIGVGTIDVFANLGQNVDINQFALASSTNASTTVISDELTMALASIQSLQGRSTDLTAEINSLTSLTSSLASTTADFASTLTSTTATTLASSTSFIKIIANAVINLLNQSGQIISSAGNWTVGQITAMTGNFQNIFAKKITFETAVISQGLEMTDQATGLTYCVVIKNGEWDKTQGDCGEPTTATTTITSIPVASSMPSTESYTPITNGISENLGTTSVTVVSDLASSSPVAVQTAPPTVSVATTISASSTSMPTPAQIPVQASTSAPAVEPVTPVTQSGSSDYPSSSN